MLAMLARNTRLDDLALLCREIGLPAVIVEDLERHVTVAFPEVPEGAGLQEVRHLGANVSARLEQPVLLTSRGLAGVLWVGLFQEGNMVLDYDALTWELPWREYAGLLCRALSRPGRRYALLFVLKNRYIRPDRLRQWLILKTLDLPPWTSKYSYQILRASLEPLGRLGVRCEVV